MGKKHTITNTLWSHLRWNEGGLSCPDGPLLVKRWHSQIWTWTDCEFVSIPRWRPQGPCARPAPTPPTSRPTPPPAPSGTACRTPRPWAPPAASVQRGSPGVERQGGSIQVGGEGVKTGHPSRASHHDRFLHGSSSSRFWFRLGSGYICRFWRWSVLAVAGFHRLLKVDEWKPFEKLIRRPCQFSGFLTGGFLTGGKLKAELCQQSLQCYWL